MNEVLVAVIAFMAGVALHFAGVAIDRVVESVRRRKQEG